ncbi:MAG: glucokinase [Xanthomonadales bacterium]|nr:glucokinase [Xanthomonadales bacterium]
MNTALVADIGGTHARFGLVANADKASGVLQIADERKFRCADHASLESVLDAYLDAIGRPTLAFASIAVAAPVWKDRISMTNLPWNFSRKEMKRLLGVSRLEVINDASAGVLATTRLEWHEVETVRQGTPEPEAARVNIIPGTGFGIGAAYLFGKAWIPVQGEGGHIGLAASEPEEYAALDALARVHGRATPENVLSGPGMLHLYQALAAVRGEQAKDMDPAEMTRLALEREDALCVDALRMYCRLLGSLAGDYALVFGAQGGLYLSGGILKRLGAEWLREGFENRFEDKGKVADEVARIPVLLVKRDHPGLLGAAAWLLNTLGQDDPSLQAVASAV